MGKGQIAAGALAALAVALPSACAQRTASQRVLLSSPLPAPVSPPIRGEIVREIDDPHLGDRWLLERDPSHPGGPGRMVLLSGVRPGSGAAGRQPWTPTPVIRLGERIVVEEHTPVVDARLEAVALNPAMAGSVFNVRLSVGGRTMRAVALGPGRAVLEGETRR
jgi:hypothetical protein